MMMARRTSSSTSSSTTTATTPDNAVFPPAGVSRSASFPSPSARRSGEEWHTRAAQPDGAAETRTPRLESATTRSPQEEQRQLHSAQPQQLPSSEHQHQQQEFVWRAPPSAVRTTREDDDYDGDNATTPPMEERRPQQWKDEIAFLISDPVVIEDKKGNLWPVSKLALSRECKLVWGALEKAKRDIHLYFEAATHKSFNDALTRGCRCLHYSGHGDKQSIFFENYGAAVEFPKEHVARLVTNQFGSTFQLVLVSACYSKLVGEAVAAAGVHHVVCVDEQEAILDDAALAFTEAFTFALASGRTVRMAFAQGCNAVWPDPNIRNAEMEKGKFRLLPLDGQHDVALFGNTPLVRAWPPDCSPVDILSMKNKIQNYPSPPQPLNFIGREVDLFRLLDWLKSMVGRNERGGLACIEGGPGTGKSALVMAFCNYINDRANSMPFQRIVFVQADIPQHNEGDGGGRALLGQLLDELQLNHPARDARLKSMLNALHGAFANINTLVVLDGVNGPLMNNKSKECLVELAKSASILVTTRDHLGMFGEKAITLEPLSFSCTARLFVCLLPSQYTENQRQTLIRSLLYSQSHGIAGPPNSNATCEVDDNFERLGSGIPKQIRQKAHNATPEEFDFLQSSATRYQNAVWSPFARLIWGIGGCAVDVVQAQHWLDQQEGESPVLLAFRAQLLDPSSYADSGIVKDPNQAYKLWNAAWEGLKWGAQIDPWAQYLCGCMFYDGSVDLLCYKTAAQYFESAALQGLAAAQFQFGVMLESGSGVTSNAADAAHYFEQAAEQGHAAARYHLGCLNEHGRGVEQDFAKALNLYLLAAYQGVASASRRLRTMMENDACFVGLGDAALRHQVASTWEQGVASNGCVGARKLPADILDGLKKQGFTYGLARSLWERYQAFLLTIWVVDNSKSMLESDGLELVQSVENPAWQVHSCTRWRELHQTIDYHARLAGLLHCPTTFRLLNDPGRAVGPRQWSVAQLGPAFLDEDVDVALSASRSVSPKGRTPLARQLRQILQTVRLLEPALRRESARVAVILATDGIPTDDQGYCDTAVQQEFSEALRAFEGLPVWMVVRLCTNEEAVVQYWNQLDSEVKLSLEVLDDFFAEAAEVQQHNPWLNYALSLHRCREMGHQHYTLDLLDERPLTKSELWEFLCVLLGDDRTSELPQPESNWMGFLSKAADLLAKEVDQWDPITKGMKPWVNLNLVKERYGPVGLFTPRTTQRGSFVSRFAPSK